VAEDVFGVDEVHNQLRVSRGGMQGQAGTPGQTAMQPASGMQGQTGTQAHGSTGSAQQTSQGGTSTSRTGRQ
jgi:hypothetical protein